MKAPDLIINGSASARIPDTTGWERDQELGQGMGQAAISCSPTGNGGVALIIKRWSVMLSISQIRSVVVKDVTGRKGVVYKYLTIEWGRATGSEPLPPFADFNIVSDDAVEFARLLQEQRDLRNKGTK